MQAAKGITVDDSGGDVRVEFTADKSEVSTKKLRCSKSCKVVSQYLKTLFPHERCCPYPDPHGSALYLEVLDPDPHLSQKSEAFSRWRPWTLKMDGWSLNTVP
jgi:hypothetical protein